MDRTGSEAEAAKEKAENLTERAKEKATDLKRQAENAAHDMRDRARSAADEQKTAAAERVGGVARALRTASDDLRDQGQPMIAEYSGHLADGLERMADSLSRRNVDDLVEGVEDFARQRPVAFLGGAMVAGFALARFMKSSAARRYERTAQSRTPYGPATTSSPGTTTGMPTSGAAMSRPASPGTGTAGVKESPDATH